MRPILSIVIATHKRADILRQCLEHLAVQTVAKQLEVIVVSDGEEPHTAALCSNAADFPFILRYDIVPKSQQGVARNNGVQMATAGIVLFINDDIFLAPNACEEHAKAHERLASQSGKEAAVLGFTTWDPAVGISPAMRWLEQSGWQFGYPMLKPYECAFVPRKIQHRFTYASHISVQKNTALSMPFLENVSLYGWEDTLWGKKLADAGIPLFYEPAAKALHHHHISMSDSLARMETLGKSAVHITTIAPELDRLPTGFKRMMLRGIALLPTMRGRHTNAFLRGISAAESLA